MAKKFIFQLQPLLLAREAAERKVLQAMAPFIKKQSSLHTEKVTALNLQKSWLGVSNIGGEIRAHLKQQLAFLTHQQAALAKEIKPHQAALIKARAAKRAIELLCDEKKKAWKKEQGKLQQLEISERVNYKNIISKNSFVMR